MRRRIVFGFALFFKMVIQDCEVLVDLREDGIHRSPPKFTLALSAYAMQHFICSAEFNLKY